MCLVIKWILNLNKQLFLNKQNLSLDVGSVYFQVLFFFWKIVRKLFPFLNQIDLMHSRLRPSSYEENAKIYRKHPFEWESASWKIWRIAQMYSFPQAPIRNINFSHYNINIMSYIIHSINLFYKYINLIDESSDIAN